MIQSPTKQHLVTLIQSESGRCASILMPTERRGRKTAQNPIRFKNLLNEAIERAQDSDDPSLKSLNALAALEQDYEFWQHQGDGLAIYVCDEFEQRFQLGHTVEEAVDVGNHFLVRPLASHACRALSARILAISWDSSRLFECDGREAVEVTDDNFPVAMHDLVARRDPEEQLQFTSHRAGAPKTSRKEAMYHGHGEGEGKIEADRQLYLSRVGQLVAEETYGDDQPLLLLATEEVAGEFTSNCEVKIADVIHASPDGLDESARAEKMNAATGELAKRSDAKLQERLGTALSQDKGSTDLVEIVKQAAGGRVDILLLGDDKAVRGRFDREQLQVAISEEGAVDLVNVAVRHTLNGGGTVVASPALDATSTTAAIYRY